MKRSGGSSPGRPEGHTYFVERPLGKGVAFALRAKGFAVVFHGEMFKDNVEDEAWILRAAEEGWVALGADRALRWNPPLKHAVFRSCLRLFNLTRNDWPGPTKAEAFVNAMPAISKLLARKKGPFVATVNKAGQISGFYGFENYEPPTP